MDPALAALITGLGVALVTYIFSPWLKARLRERQTNDPALGWQTAVKAVTDRADKLEKRVTSLETEVVRLEDENATKTATIARLENVARDQGRMIIARDGRISQLIHVLRNASLDVPRADPAMEYWLTQTPSGGIATR